MIAYLALGLLIAAVLLISLDLWAKAETRTAKRVLGLVAIILTLLVAVFLATRGQWLLALLPLFYTVTRLIGVGKAFSDILGHLFGAKGSSSTKRSFGSDRSHKGDAQALSESDALEILGLDKRASREDINAAYKKMMAQCHPDRGGSAWLAERLNAARDRLIKK